VIDAKSELITRIIETCIARIPFWLRPQRTTDKKNMIEFLNGSVMFDSVREPGYGHRARLDADPRTYFGDRRYPESEEVNRGRLTARHALDLQTVSDSRRNWKREHGLARGQVEKRERKVALGSVTLAADFIPWPMTPELFPTKDFIRAHPVPGGFTPLDVTRKHVSPLRDVCERYRLSPQGSRKELADAGRAAVVLAVDYEQNVDSHTTKVWFAQKPADDYEALQGANDLVFDSIVIDTSDRDRNRDFQAYAITGESVDDGFEPDDSESTTTRNAFAWPGTRTADRDSSGSWCR